MSDASASSIGVRVGLARLLTEYRKRTGDPYSRLAEKTGLSRGYFGYLMNAAVPFRVEESTVLKLSTGLSIPVDVVRNAALESGGYAVDGLATLPDDLRLALEEMRELDPEQIDFLRTVIRSLRAASGH